MLNFLLNLSFHYINFSDKYILFLIKSNQFIEDFFLIFKLIILILLFLLGKFLIASKKLFEQLGSNRKLHKFIFNFF